ncbi:MAG TPA: D-alanyl-D-alanine carboxypeptidase family protein [Fimbriimonas sp.]|nr:D-alanyl-D-alanine carboxypeptidase family protein [Fimbriimonas sp.]
MTRYRSTFLALLALPAFAAAQSVTAESAIVMDSSSGKVLWSKNADKELYPASTTKIMTTLLLLEHCKPDDVIVAPMDVTKVRESSMHLKPGERVRAEDMVYALMLRSANDGCYAVACHIAGSVEKFADMMNARAKEIGCTHTHFDNPNGLNDPLHYTTAHDLALIGREAMKYPAFRNIVRTEKTKISRGTNWKDLWMVNHNKILKRDPTCDGIKTGWTIPAGHCFVGSASRQGWRVITVVMKSKSWENDTETLFNWAFGMYRKHDEVSEGQSVAQVPLAGAPVQNVPATVAEDAYTLVAKNQKPSSAQQVVVAPALSAPISRFQQVGQLVIHDADGFAQSVPLIATQDVPANAAAVTAKAGGTGGKWLLCLGLMGGGIYLRGRTRKKTLRVLRSYPFR